MATESNVTIVAAGQTDAIVGSLGDVVPPLVAISTHTTLANDSLPVNVSFSEFALDFAVDDIQLSSGVATDLVVQEEGVSARFLVKDMADGFVTVGLRPGAVYDPIGNVNVIRTLGGAAGVCAWSTVDAHCYMYRWQLPSPSRSRLMARRLEWACSHPCGTPQVRI